MRPVLQILGGFVGIAGLLALLALALYTVWRVVMIVVSFLPVIGKKHKHPDWDHLQKTRQAERSTGVTKVRRKRR